MIRNAFGLVYTSDDNMGLKELTLERTVASVPFGGRYRIIDFIMSNMVNSGIISIAVITQKNYSSLLDHLGSGSPWDLHRKSEGLRMIPPFSTTETGTYRGTIDAFRAARDFMSHTQYRYCFFHDCKTVYSTDYTQMMEQHERTQADITILYHVDNEEKDDSSFSSFDREKNILYFDVDENERIIDMEIDSTLNHSKKMSLACLLIDRQLLDYLVDEAFSRGHSDFIRDVLIKKYQSLRIFGFEHKGYAARMSGVDSYYKANMDLLDKDVRDDLFAQRVYTKVKDEVPCLYKSSSVSKNSILSDGCIIEGTVENSVLGRGVHVHTGAVIKNSIVMQGSEIQENVQLENVILDKDVIVRRGRRVVGPGNYPIVVRKGSVI